MIKTYEVEEYHYDTVEEKEQHITKMIADGWTKCFMKFGAVFARLERGEYNYKYIKNNTNTKGMEN